MRRIYKILIVIFAALFLLGLVFFVLKITVLKSYFQPKNNKTVVTQRFNVFKDETYGFSIKYPSYATKDRLSDEDLKNNYVMRVVQNNDPGYLMTTRLESGLRLPSELSRVDVIDLVTDGALHSLPLEYPNYKLLSNQKFTASSKPAHQLTFTYVNKLNITMKQTLVLIALDQDKAAYVSLQSKNADYEKLNEILYKPIISSITIDDSPRADEVKN